MKCRCAKRGRTRRRIKCRRGKKRWMRGRLGRGGSLSGEPRPRGRGGAVLRRNFSMDQGGGVVQIPQRPQQQQQQPQPQQQQQQQCSEVGVAVRQRPPPPAPPTRRSYPSASFNNTKYPSITITGPAAAVKNRSPSPRGRELLAAVNEIHEQMRRREETAENSETEDKEETEDEFHENELHSGRRRPVSAGQRACSSPLSPPLTHLS